MSGHWGHLPQISARARATYEGINRRTDRKGNIRSFRVSIINPYESARSETIPRGYPANVVGARHAVRHVTARHDTPRHASSACGGIVSRFASMSDYTGRILSCSRWLRVRTTYVPRTYVRWSAVRCPCRLNRAVARRGVNAISTIQTGHREVTLQRHKNEHRALRIPSSVF